MVLVRPPSRSGQADRCVRASAPGAGARRGDARHDRGWRERERDHYPHQPGRSHHASSPQPPLLTVTDDVVTTVTYSAQSYTFARPRFHGFREARTARDRSLRHLYRSADLRLTQLRRRLGSLKPSSTRSPRRPGPRTRRRPMNHPAQPRRTVRVTAAGTGWSGAQRWLRHCARVAG